MNLEPAVAAGELLARVDDVDYIRIHAVLSRDAAGALAYYAGAAEWPTTAAARLAARDAEIARLLAENERMAELLGGRTVLALPAPSEPLPFEVELPAHEVRPRVECPHCLATFKNQGGLNIHTTKIHADLLPAAARRAPRKPAAPVLAEPPPAAAVEAPAMAEVRIRPSPCPICHKVFATERQLQAHMERPHPEPAPVAEVVEAPAPPPEPRPPRPKPTLIPDDPTWRCADCGKRPGTDGAFARSIRNPRYCISCAKDRPIAGTQAA